MKAPEFIQDQPSWQLLQWIYLLLFALLPWGFEPETGLGWRVVWPTEPVLAILALGLFRMFMANPRGVWQALKPLWRHPVVLSSAVWIIWPVLMILFSEFPGISLKYAVIAITHVVVFLIGGLLFPGLIWRWLHVFSVSFVLLVLVVLSRHILTWRWDGQYAVLSPMPFFENHTGYAAMIVWCMALWLFWWNNATSAWLGIPDRYRKSVLLTIALVLLAGLAVSTCRAAWLSVVGAIAIVYGSTLLPGVLSRWSFWAGVAGFTVLTFYWAGLKAPADVSTAERLNRYSSACRMTAERPLTGWGSGTFQYTYIPFQQPEEMTRLSLTEPFYFRSLTTQGRGGGAHSEYFRALSETGWPGLVWLLAWLTVVIRYTWRGRDTEKSLLPLLAGFVAYWLHGLYNDYFHDARFAALSWLFVVVLVKKPEFSFTQPKADVTKNI